MKTILPVLILLLSLACTDQSDDLLPFKTGFEYTIGKHHNAKIRFHSDGTYQRSEDIDVWRRDPSDPSRIETLMVLIDRIDGQWKIKNDTLYLKDISVMSCRCAPWHAMSMDDFEPCDHSKLRLSFGSEEWYRDFRVTSINNDNIEVRPNYLDLLDF